MIGQGFVKNYSGLMATRVFLGVFEGGLFPGVNYYISKCLLSVMASKLCVANRWISAVVCAL